MLPDGYTPIPAGKIASVVLYLEMRGPRRLASGRGGRTSSSRRSAGEDGARYRAIYRAVGERWLWFSRLALSDADLAAILDDPDVEAYEVRLGGEPVGLLELDFRAAPDCELAFLGLVESADRLRRRALDSWTRRSRRPGRGRSPASGCTPATSTTPARSASTGARAFAPTRRRSRSPTIPRLTGLLPPDGRAALAGRSR